MSADAALLRAAEALRAAPKVLVVAHERPDADAIGSTVAAAMIATSLGASVTLFNVDGCPDKLLFLPWADRVVDTLPADASFDATVLLDCSQRSRAGERFPTQGWGRTVICLDHHVTHDPNVADIFAHDVAAAATGELVYRLAVAAGVAVDRDMATALYAAILTDTGSFRYSSTHPGSLEIGAALLRTGIDAWDVASAVYESESLPRVRLIGAALETLELEHDGRLASLAITQSMLRRTGANEEMTDGIVNHARAIHGVDVAALIVEIAPGQFRVNLRSRGKVNVAAVASQYGGGGHHNAAGCNLRGTVDEVRSALAVALGRVLDPAAPPT